MSEKPQSQNITMLAYLLVLLVASFVDFYSPQVSGGFVNFFLGTEIDFDDASHVRYRFLLFLIATLAFLVSCISLFFLRFNQLIIDVAATIRWPIILLCVIFYGFAWTKYMSLSLCKTCFLASDILFLVMTWLFFFGMHLIAFTFYTKCKHARTFSKIFKRGA